MAGSVIQATGAVEFEDGLWIGNQIMTRNGLQRGPRTLPEVLPGEQSTHPDSTRSRLNSNFLRSAWLPGCHAVRI